MRRTLLRSLHNKPLHAQGVSVPYTIDNWKEKIAGRSDLSSQVVHLTRGAEVDGKKFGPIDVLIKILKERVINPSTTESGFICGDKPATCFQDAPLYSLAQNIYTEQEYRKENPEAKIRYVGAGITLPKSFIFKYGGRPVLYEKTATAKKLLPPDEYWRIVNLKLQEKGGVIDWTHEREWRVPSSVEFPLSEVTVILPSQSGYERFIKLARKEKDVDILGSIRGIVHLGAVFF